jgi:hypothetical protein
LPLSGRPITAVQAATHQVRSANQVESLIKAGKLAPGDEVIWAAGEYSNEVLNIEGVCFPAERIWRATFRRIGQTGAAGAVLRNL